MIDKEKLKQHWEEHKKFYIGLGIGIAGVTIIALAFQNRQLMKTLAQAKNINTNVNLPTATANTIVLPALGDPGDVVQNLRTLETFASKGELAKVLELPRSRVADYFAGRLAHLQGDQYAVIGKAGMPIPQLA